MTVRVLDRLHCADNDKALLQAFGLILAGSLIVLAALLHVLPRQIGA